MMMQKHEIDDARSRGCLVEIYETGSRWRLDENRCVEVYTVFFCNVIENPSSVEDMKDISI